MVGWFRAGAAEDATDGIASACAEVTRRVMQLLTTEGLPAASVFVVGFGQGGEVGLRLAATLPLRLGGYVGLFGDGMPVAEKKGLTFEVPVAICVPESAVVETTTADVFRVLPRDDFSRQLDHAVAWLRPRLAGTPPAAPPQRRRGRVSWRIEASDNDATTAYFVVPPGCEGLLGRFPIICCGASFALQARAPGLVATTFYSPTPAATAEAIALRIGRRFCDPAAAEGAAHVCPIT
ncbi:hypothetical protein CTAYLR_005677 [Chrysophaeum taylorii]|uniref:Phospholipase/carboxylesterase/thioesterase domain-containing protein n=1 Tax=Chrysophaeum taylorii TaxID=2483200 RepID=A0AAD7UKP6_9STRA|nr:hypothetical protein CTAYLR_005677 [Chrysophaeum taylorii]